MGGTRDLLFFKMPRPTEGSTQRVPWLFNLWVKRPGRDTGSWPVRSAGTKNGRKFKYFLCPICLRDPAVARTSLLDSETSFTISRLVVTLLHNYTVIAFLFQLKLISECPVQRFIIAQTSVIIIIFIIITAVQETEKHAIRYNAISAGHSIPCMTVLV